MPSPLQGFDQVIAMTQAHVNATINTHFRLDPKLLYLDVEGDWGTISSEMDPPTVSFYIPSEIHKVHFCVNLASGKCSWYKIDHIMHPPTVIVMRADIAKWTLTFTVNLGLDKVDQVPKEIKDKIKFLGSYSLSQLLLDFTTAVLFGHIWS